MVLLLGFFSSCGTKHFSKKDYTFFDESFKPEPASLLRMDGVYVLSKIWTNENGGIEKEPKEHKFYKFYII